MPNKIWIGLPEDLEAALTAACADVDEQGKFRYEGPVCDLIHRRGDDLKIDAHSFCFLSGFRVPILDVLREYPSLPVKLGRETENS